AMPIVSFALGGNSDGGGDAAPVTIRSGLSAAGTITTAGDDACGIHGESIGGGGGSGGNAVVMTAGAGITLGMAKGGTAGGGGHGGSVEITSNSNITTQGARAHGLYAESLGGAGGAGGTSLVKSISIPLPEMPNIAATFSLGGMGGGGGDGNAVTIATGGNVATGGEGAYGVFAQSVGGGGGTGGISTNKSFTVMTLSAIGTIGGAGGDGGAGGAVSATSTGAIDTQSDHAHGLLAQSVGGGGGAGGSSIMEKFAAADIDDILTSLASPGAAMELTVGGIGGGGGAGGGVDVTTGGAITTAGVGAHGVLAQSIGGGGGAGGDAHVLDLSYIPSVPDAVSGCLGYTGGIALGGLNFVAGDGAAVDVDNRGTIVTGGDFAHGLYAQSVGGGGGTVGLSITDPFELLAPTAKSTLNLNHGGHGSGSVVTIDNAGDITTSGAFAHGILAQSVGGGGGFAAISETAGHSEMSLVGHMLGLAYQGVDVGVAFLGSAGGAGSAGDVTITHTGTVETFGPSAHGILAQSASTQGAAGAATVVADGQVNVRGRDAVGIFAQSSSSHGAAEAVTVVVNGQVNAWGPGAVGIIAESRGADGQGGDVIITINSGGSVQGASDAFAGVLLGADDGVNVLTNHGSITAVGGLAVGASARGATVDNYGLIHGNIALGEVDSVFTNHPGARLNTGEMLGTGTLINAGTLSPGGPGESRTTVIGADLVLAGDGLLEIEIGGLDEDAYDRLLVEGLLNGGDGLPPAGTVTFSLPETFDIAATIPPAASTLFPFLQVQTPWGSDPAMMFDFPAWPAFFDCDVFREGNAMVLRATNTRRYGDANDDGRVDLDDFVLLKRNFGADDSATWAMADFNGDRRVDLDDFAILKTHFGTAAVPEPATLALGALGGLAIRRRRRGR
ncbi:MAG: dockerin type I domain-containing protein, partial [Planctomycetota bacterium]